MEAWIRLLRTGRKPLCVFQPLMSTHETAGTPSPHLRNVSKSSTSPTYARKTQNAERDALNERTRDAKRGLGYPLTPPVPRFFFSKSSKVLTKRKNLVKFLRSRSMARAVNVTHSAFCCCGNHFSVTLLGITSRHPVTILAILVGGGVSKGRITSNVVRPAFAYFLTVCAHLSAHLAS